MRLVYNPRVQQDVAKALRYYDEAGGEDLGDAFFDELTASVELARAAGTISPGIRRVAAREFGTLPLSFSVSHRWRHAARAGGAAQPAASVFRVAPQMMADRAQPS